MTPEHQSEAQAIAEPITEEAIARLANAGLAPHEIAQSLILTGAGLLAGSLGPNGAGHELQAIAAKTAEWIEQIADAVERENKK